MAISAHELQCLYLAYFGRPADKSGMDYYLDPASDWRIFSGEPDVAVGFSNSPESASLYGTQFGEQQVRLIYRNLFNRDAEQGGIDYWLEQIETGKIPPAGAALAILLGAQGTDAQVVANKLALCEEFFAAVNTEAEIEGYAGDTAAMLARTLVATVGADTASLTAARGLLADRIAQIAEGLDGPLELAFTVGLDRLFGGEGDDFFEAVTGVVNPTFGEDDEADGGAGHDTLALTIEAVGPKTLGRTRNIETILVRNRDDEQMHIDISRMQGATHVLSTESVGELSFSNLGDDHAGGFVSGTTNAADLRFTWHHGTHARLAVGGSSTGHLTAAGDEVVDTAVSLAGIDEAGEFTLAHLSLFGSKNKLLHLDNGDRGHDLRVEALYIAAADAEIELVGDGSVALLGIDADLKRFDASAFEGERVEFDVGLEGALSGDFEYAGSGGADVVHLRGTSAVASIAGGAGQDVLVLHAGAALAAGHTGLEIVEVLDGASLNAAALTNERIVVRDGNGQFGVRLRELNGEQARNIEIHSADGENGAIELEFGDADRDLWDAEIDLVGASISLGEFKVGFARGLRLHTDGGFTLSKLDDSTSTIRHFTATGQGDVAIDLGQATFSDDTNFAVDLSALQGRATLNMGSLSLNTLGISIKDAQGTDSIVGSVSSDHLEFTGGADTVRLGIGNDTFSFNGKAGSNAMESGVTFEYRNQNDSRLTGSANAQFNGAIHADEADSIEDIRADAAFLEATGTAFELSTLATGSSFVELEGFALLTNNTVAARGFALVRQGADAFILQDTNGDTRLGAGDFVVRLVGTGNFAQNEFTLTEQGTLRYTSIVD